MGLEMGAKAEQDLYLPGFFKNYSTTVSQRPTSLQSIDPSSRAKISRIYIPASKHRGHPCCDQ